MYLTRLVIFSLAMVFLIIDSGISSASDKLSISGYYKNFSVALDQPEVENLQESIDQSIKGSMTNRLRLKFFHRVNEWFSINLAYDLSPVVQDKTLFDDQILDFGLKSQTYRALDLDSRLYPEKDEKPSSFAIFQNLDRLFITINSKLADIYLGRQAIAWGSAHVINPTDLITPYAFNELDVEDRRGVDALRVRVPISSLEEFDAGYVFGDDFKFENSAFFLRGKFYYGYTDISLMLVGFQKNLLTGFDLTRSIGGAGFWLEGGYVFTDALNGNSHKNDKDYFRSSLGFDYSLRNGTYLFAEYHFNQAGATDPDDYLSRMIKTAYTEGSVCLLGKHYFIPGVSYQVTPLITLSGEVLINLSDPSLFLTPKLEHNIAENIYLLIGAYIGLGRNPIQVTNQDSESTLRLRSEFGSYPDFYFTSFRVYF